MIINGQEKEFNNISITNLLKELEVDLSRVVVEVNQDIINKEKYNEVILNKEDKIEIIAFVGGG